METKKLEELMEELIRLQILILKNSMSQIELIGELNSLHFKPKRIADLIGSNANAVRVNIHHLKTKKEKKS